MVAALLEKMRQHPLRCIPFRDYMEICLYHEPHGYYRNDKPKLGKEGDFYTSASIGSLMGEILGSYAAKQWRKEPCPPGCLGLTEWGGGDGKLAAAILGELELCAPELYGHLTYTIIESSGYHRRLQRETLQAHSLKLRFATEEEWFAETPHPGEIVLANELLDAFPVHRIRRSGSGLQENYVSWNDTEQSFQEEWFPVQGGPIVAYIERQDIQLADGQMAEINLAADEWMMRVGQRLADGQLIVIDYGDRAEELYGSHRMKGTLLCYRQHQAYDNPYVHQGGQDITSHVNFTACMSAGLKGGFEDARLQTQREFLVEQGILQRLQDHADPNPFSEAARKNRAIRQLLLSDQMSELFKVLVLMKKR